MYRRLRDANFFVVRVRQWCWPEMSLHLPYAYAFLQSTPNYRKNNDRTDYFVFVRTRDDNLRRKHQRKRIKPSIFSKWVKEESQTSQQGKFNGEKFQKTKKSREFLHVYKFDKKKRFDKESKNPKQKRIKSKPIQPKKKKKLNQK